MPLRDVPLPRLVAWMASTFPLEGPEPEILSIWSAEQGRQRQRATRARL